jgi:hypothetical protein
MGLMWIEAIISTEDLRRTLSEFAPVTIRLSKGGGELALESPSEVSLVADQGVRVVCTAHLHWPILGVNVPLTLKSLIILLCPVIKARSNGNELVLRLEIEHADFALVPTVIDNRITAGVNAELTKKHVELSWRYSDTLEHVFHLPDALAPVESLGLVVTGGVVKVTNEAVGLAVALRCDVRRADQQRASENPPPDAERHPAPLPAARRSAPSAAWLSPATMATRGCIAALALGAVFALGRASRHRQRWFAR